ncbi:hypothetical protein AAG570_002371 [Ranatra chinensis]|uniref:Uncharacterized protein n=1 Tax=Ranatra chinensis TaxID=642074 RepID=A0ABD0Y7C5_9HEMI
MASKRRNIHWSDTMKKNPGHSALSGTRWELQPENSGKAPGHSNSRYHGRRGSLGLCRGDHGTRQRLWHRLSSGPLTPPLPYHSHHAGPHSDVTSVLPVAMVSGGLRVLGERKRRQEAE